MTRQADRRRAVITGLGMVSPVGIGRDECWKNLREGVSGIGPITRFDASAFDATIAGEVKGFDPTRWVEKREVKRIDIYAQYAIAAAMEAVSDSGLNVPAEDADRCGCVIGTGIGGLTTIEEQLQRFLEKGPGKVSAFLVPKMMANAASGLVGLHLGLKGPNYGCVSACASGAHSIGDGLRLIQDDWADVVVAGGAEAPVTYLGVSGFTALGALSRRNDDPTRASRPFDRDRDGFVVAEGAGVLVIEELEHARRRGANIYAELRGFGASCDAFHITAPDETGAGPARAMRLALEDAGVPLDAVAYVNAHGTSTSLNDKVETLALKKAFGEGARRLAVSSTKGMTGHLLGGAGALEAAITALAIRDRVAPPTVNYENPDPDCDLDYVPNAAREMDIRVAISNSLGFGGHNAVLCLGRFED
jgi:3-oxoacyl-[acyl-carrier-protein] synthase II